MANYRKLYGIGSVWDVDVVYNDAVGTFRWELELVQRNGIIHWDLNKIFCRGGYDGAFRFDADIQAAAIDWPCGDDSNGKRIIIGCVAYTQSRNSGFTVGATAGASSTGVSGSLGINYQAGYQGHRCEWEMRLQVCPGGTCPEVTTNKNQTQTTDNDYKWFNYCLGDMKAKAGSELTEHQPQLKIEDCDTDPARDTKLPLSSGGTILDANPL